MMLVNPRKLGVEQELSRDIPKVGTSPEPVAAPWEGSHTGGTWIQLQFWHQISNSTEWNYPLALFLPGKG